MVLNKIVLTTFVLFSMANGKGFFINHADICDKERSAKCMNDIQTVKKLQSILNRQVHAGLEPDGKWGNDTKKAVIAFQKKYALKPADGWVGQSTKEKLDTFNRKVKHFIDYDDICDIQQSTKCTHNLQIVKKLQRILNRQVHADLEPDGKWGNDTKKAVIAFQKKYALKPADGWVGKATKEKLDQLSQPITFFRSSKSTTNKRKANSYFAHYDDLCDEKQSTKCDNNVARVKTLQKILNKKVHADLEADGKWGDNTKKAVIAFQKKYRLAPADGWVGKATKEKLDQILAHVNSKRHHLNSYDDFRRTVNLQSSFKVFKNNTLLAKANSRNTKLKIDISEQRIRFYVNNKVAIDAPCTTGAKHKFEPNTKIYRDKHTPKGTFRILEKIADKRSTIFGEMYIDGRKVYHGDRRKYKGPKAKYVGASLKHWMRLTGGGIGLHASKYIKRHPGTNGCIRLPYHVASTIFKKVRPGTQVSIVN